MPTDTTTDLLPDVPQDVYEDAMNAYWATDPKSATRRLKAAFAVVWAAAHVETEAPKPNLGGTDWIWEDEDGNQFGITGDGSVTVNAVNEYTTLTAAQWAEVAAVVAHVRRVVGTPEEIA